MIGMKVIYTPKHILRGWVFASHHLYWLSVWIFSFSLIIVQINQNDDYVASWMTICSLIHWVTCTWHVYGFSMVGFHDSLMVFSSNCNTVG